MLLGDFEIIKAANRVLTRATAFTLACILVLPSRSPGAEGERQLLTTAPAKIGITNNVLHEIDERLFGQFMEKDGRETGPEFGMQKKGRRLQTDIVEKLKQMQIPLIRFPGGAALEWTGTMNLTDMIDNVPDRPDYIGRTNLAEGVLNRFGYDEFLTLCEQLSAKALLVVNFSNGVLKRKPVEKAAAEAAALVAYVNARQITKLPEDMVDWPAVRANNGHPRPYNAPIYQIGNEAWCFIETLRKSAMSDSEIIDWLIVCYRAYIDAMRAIDPEIELIIDGQLEQIAGLEGLTARIKSDLGNSINYLAYHRYAPWEISTIEGATGNPLRPSQLNERDMWQALVAGTDFDPVSGFSVIADDPSVRLATEHGYNLAATEWNLNAFWPAELVEKEGSSNPFCSMLARGIGAAGFLNAFMRRGNQIKIACQSMLVGHVWDITAIHIIEEKDQGKKTSVFHPTGQVAMLYARNHGDTFLEVTTEGIPTYEQPIRLGAIAAQKKVALLDVCATRTKNRVYVHLINRSIDTDIPVAIDIDSIPGRPGVLANWHIVNGAPSSNSAPATYTTEKVRVDEKVLNAVVPMHSVSCIVIEMHQRDM